MQNCPFGAVQLRPGTTNTESHSLWNAPPWLLPVAHSVFENEASDGSQTACYPIVICEGYSGLQRIWERVPGSVPGPYSGPDSPAAVPAGLPGAVSPLRLLRGQAPTWQRGCHSTRACLHSRTIPLSIWVGHLHRIGASETHNVGTDTAGPSGRLRAFV